MNHRKILVVDDDSPDGTGQLADELALADPDRVHVMHRAGKGGLGAAYLAGVDYVVAAENSVRVGTVVAGQADIARNIPAPDEAQFAAGGRAEARGGASLSADVGANADLSARITFG